MDRHNGAISVLQIVLWEICTISQPTPENRRPVTLEEAPQSIIDLIHSSGMPAAERPTAVEFHNVVQKAMQP